HTNPHSFPTRRSSDLLTKQMGRSPTIHEIADALEITPEEVVHAQEAAKSPHSIHETIFENDGDPITLLDQIADEDTNWFDKLTLDRKSTRLNSSHVKI